MTRRSARKLGIAPSPVNTSAAVASGLDLLASFVKERAASKEVPTDFAAFERSLHARVMQVEREILASEFAKADVNVEAVEVGGVVYRRVVRCSDEYVTAAGPVRVERTLYKDRTRGDSISICPMELRLGIVESRWTPQAAQLATWMVSQLAPGVVEELLDRVGNMNPSKSALDRLPKQLLGASEEDRAEFDSALRAGEVIPEATATVAVSLDGVLAPMKDGQAVEKRALTAAKGKLAMGPAGYREVGCGTISLYDKEGELLRVIRMARMPEAKKATLKAILEAELSPILRQRPDVCLVKLADGAKDNWEFLAKALPTGIEVLDFYHAAEHLAGAFGAAFGEGSVEAQRHFDLRRYSLRHDDDGVDVVIRALAALAKKLPTNDKVMRALKYFRANRKRMRYAEVAAKNLPIGSGVVEAACKTLVAQRLKLSGMRWGTEGGQAILNFRAWHQSDRFDRAWALIAAQYKAEVTIIANVVNLADLRTEERQ